MPDHAPPTSAALEAVRLVPYEHGGARFPSWRLELARFTPAIICGPNSKVLKKVNIPPHEPLSTIPLGNLARWVFGAEQTSWFDYGVRTEHYEGGERRWNEKIVQNLVGLLRDHPGNKEFFDLIPSPLKEIPTSVQDEASTTPITVFLHRTHGDDPVDGLEDWHAARKKEAVKALIADECADLRATLGARVDALERAYSRRRRVISALTPIISKLQACQQITSITEMFGLPVRERPKRSPWRELGYGTLVHPTPDKQWRERLYQFRTVELQALLDLCQKMIENPQINAALDDAADSFLTELRDGASPYLDYLDRYRDLHPGSRAELRETLRRGIELAQLSEPVRDALVQGELNSILRMVLDLQPAQGNGLKGRRAAAVKDFNLDWLNPATETPLAKKLAESWTGTLSDSLDGGGFVLKTLAQGSAQLALEAKKSGLVDEKIFALLYRQLVSICAMTGAEEKAFGEALEQFASTRNYEAIDSFLFDAKSGLLSRTARISGTALGVVTLTARLLLFKTCVDEALQQPEGSGTQLAWLKSAGAAVDATAAAAQLASTFRENERFKSLARSLNLDTSKIAPAATVIGVAADLVSFLISCEEHRDALDNNRSAKFRDEKFYAAAFDGAKLVMSGIALIAGWEVAVIGIAIMGLKYATTNVDAWVPHIPFAPTEVKPAPHKVIETLFSEMINEDKHGFYTSINKLKNIGPVRDDADQLVLQTTQMLSRLEAGVTPDSRLFWDLAPPALDEEDETDDFTRRKRNSNTLYQARLIIRSEWGPFDAKTLERLVKHSKL